MHREAALWSQFTVPAYRRPCRPSAQRCATSPLVCRNLPTRSILLLIPPAAVAAAIAPWGCAEAREQGKLSPSADASSSSAGGRHPASPRRADSGSDAVSCWSLRPRCVRGIRVRNCNLPLVTESLLGHCITSRTANALKSSSRICMMSQWSTRWACLTTHSPPQVDCARWPG